MTLGRWSLLTLFFVSWCIVVSLHGIGCWGAIITVKEGERSGEGMDVGSKKRRRHTAADGSVREYDPDARAWVVVKSSGDAENDDDRTVLAIEGRAFPLDFGAGEFLVGGKPIFVMPASARVSDAQVDGDTGRTVWDGAVILSRYLEEERNRFAGKHFLELGAGTGLSGLSAAALGAASVTLTDLKYCLKSLEANMHASDLASRCRVLELDWLNPDLTDIGEIDVVIAADVVWLKKLVEPLVALLAKLKMLRPGVEFYLSHQTRSTETDDALFAELSKAAFRVKRIPPPVSIAAKTPAKLQLMQLLHD